MLFVYLQFLIACLSFLTFAVKVTLPQNRLQLAFTLVLTNVAFKFVVNQSLPRISYLTYLVILVLNLQIHVFTNFLNCILIQIISSGFKGRRMWVK